MNTNIKNALIFVVGAVTGAAATWRFIKIRYDKIVQEEIDSIKKTFSRPEATKLEDVKKPGPPKPEPKKSPDVKTDKTDIMGYYSDKLKDSGYTNYSEPDTSDEVKEEEKVEEPVDRPYVISPQDFGEFYDYEKISLTHYEDGVLADENDEIVDNVDDTVGSDYADHFGDYEVDAVHIRNDKKRYDYEILRVLGKYSDVVGSNPH